MRLGGARERRLAGIKLLNQTAMFSKIEIGICLFMVLGVAVLNYITGHFFESMLSFISGGVLVLAILGVQAACTKLDDARSVRSDLERELSYCEEASNLLASDK